MIQSLVINVIREAAFCEFVPANDVILSLNYTGV